MLVDMEYRRLGNSELSVSVLGIGGQSLGGGMYYRNDREALATLAEALEAGINFFDTADHYNQGLSEILIGKALKGRRQQAVIATKVGTRYSKTAGIALKLRPLLRPVSGLIKGSKNRLHQIRNRHKHSDFSEAHLRRAVEASLRRLQTDHLDLLQLHKPSSDVIARADFLTTIQRLRKEGKIRTFGIACDHEEDMIPDALAALQLPELDTLQLTINLAQRQALEQVVPLVREKGVGLLVRNPRDQGYLTDEGSDIMAETYDKSSEAVRERMHRARQFQFLTRSGRTLEQAALQYLLQLPGVSSVLPRLHQRQKLTTALGALTAPPLTAEELAQIEQIAFD